MQKHLLYINLFTITSALALAACADEDQVVPIEEKTPIVINVGEEDGKSITRTVITDGTDKTMQNFDKNTRIFFVMKSEYDENNPDFNTDAEGKKDKYVVCSGLVTSGTNKVIFDANNQKYWDDAHARSSQLSLWAFAQKDYPNNWPTYAFQNTSYYISNNYSWSTTQVNPTIASFSVLNGSTQQSTDDLNRQDLLFCNYFVDYRNNSKVDAAKQQDNRLKFNFTGRNFPNSIDMKFYHAMSKIVINIKAGDGFNADGSDLNLKNNSVDKLSGFNTAGAFNIKDGEFQSISATTTITKIPCVATSNTEGQSNYTLEALVLPNIHEYLSTNSSSDLNSRFVENSGDIMIELTANNNTYKISSGMLYDKLVGKTGATKKEFTAASPSYNYIPLEAGKKYVFTFIISKSSIDNISAEVADWEIVTADNINPSNARINLLLEEKRGNALTTSEELAVYRSAETIDSYNDNEIGQNAWWSGYNSDANKSLFYYKQLTGETEAKWRLSKNWYWPDNLTLYHFRSIMPSNVIVSTDNTDTQNPKDYVSIKSTPNYQDVRWGAPMRDIEDNEVNDKENFKFSYSFEKGFDVPLDHSSNTSSMSQIYQGIGPTEDKIKFTLFHMLSEISVRLTTSEGEDKVEFTKTVGSTTKNTKIELEGCFEEGTILLGNGLVAPVITSKRVYAITDNYTTKDATVDYGAIPQQLDNNAKLKITTADGNLYIVDLNTIKVKAEKITSSNFKIPYSVDTNGDYTINYWYPSYRYIYSLNLTKTGISNIEASVVDWETVNIPNQDVTIK